MNKGHQGGGAWSTIAVTIWENKLRWFRRKKSGGKKYARKLAIKFIRRAETKDIKEQMP